jgi:hypothetical protein
MNNIRLKRRQEKTKRHAEKTQRQARKESTQWQARKDTSSRKGKGKQCMTHRQTKKSSKADNKNSKKSYIKVNR